MAELSDADILRILELIDRSSFDYFQLTLGDLHLTVSKTGLPTEALPGGAAATASGAAAARAPSGPPRPAEPAAEAAALPSTPPVQAVAPAVPPRAGDATRDTGSVAEGGPTTPPPSADATAGLVPVRAPMVGTFYVAPAPGAPPFVEVGATVQEDTTVGLVEAMKVFTSVLAGTRGVLAQRLVENEQFVEYGQTLFLVRPEPA